MKNILLHEPFFFSDELKNLSNCINSGWVSTGGQYVRKLELQISKFTKSKYSVALNSGTSALDLSLKAINIENGDEVIVPTITFIAPVNSILYNNAKPIFMDVDEYGNIDVEKVESFLFKETRFNGKYTINKKTKKKIRAIIVVHVFGNVSSFKKLIKLCKKKNIKIIEDASESMGSFLALSSSSIKQHTGTLGDIGCFSFNANKIITTGAGGAIITNSKKVYEKIQHISTQAKKDAIKFIHDEVGYNMKLNNISASIGVSQFKVINKILQKKKKIHQFYKKNINKLNNFKVISPPSYSKSNFWINLLKIKHNKSKEFKEFVINKFFDEGIQVRPVWYPNHLQEKMVKFQRYNLKNFQDYFDQTICLPSGYNLKNYEMNKVIKILLRIQSEL